MVNADGAQTEAFRNSGHTFGTTPRERHAAWLAERDAYFCLVPPSSIVCRTHMSREYDHNSMQFTNNWLQTVTGVKIVIVVSIVVFSAVSPFNILFK